LKVEALATKTSQRKPRNENLATKISAIVQAKSGAYLVFEDNVFEDNVFEGNSFEGNSFEGNAFEANQPQRRPALEALYQLYLKNENSASFIRSVADHYTIGTLERLTAFGKRGGRRAAALALGFLGDYQSNAVLGRALHDKDRAVRLLAEHGLRQLWFRAGNSEQFLALHQLVRLNDNGQYHEVIQQSTQLIHKAPLLAEAWNQRAIAQYGMFEFEDSSMDCHQALEINPYHFNAAMGMGHCYLQLEDLELALDCFRRALSLNPSLENVRLQIRQLEKAVGKDRTEE